MFFSETRCSVTGESLTYRKAISLATFSFHVHKLYYCSH